MSEQNNRRPRSLTIGEKSSKLEKLKSTIHQLGSGSIIEEWRNVLESYAARKLTVSKDRILAMSDIADRYGALFQDIYLAVLWKFAFPFELLWIRKASRARFLGQKNIKLLHGHRPPYLKESPSCR
jgi:hypothetical protein